MSKKDKLSTDSYKGVRDFYPEDQAFLNYLFATCKRVANSFGYLEYSASILEPAELYKSKGAENEEIINEQTYTFVDRGEREVTLRPEMTPTVARMVAAKRRELGFPLRLFSIPNLFRYERPQRGRLREHWQLNVDLFGSSSPQADAEVITVAHKLMLEFGAQEKDFSVRLSSRAFLNTLIGELKLSAEDGRTLLMTLDRRAKMPADEFEATLKSLGVPLERLSPTNTPADVATVLAQLEGAGITNASFDPSVVRGFDYYTGVVFEVFDSHPDNNRSMFGGGRYDNLTALFDDEPIPGFGFGMGDVTIRDFLAVRDLLPRYIPTTKVYIATATSALSADAAALADELRSAGVNTEVDFGDKKLADQIKTASKHAVPFLIVVGEDELASGTFTVRDLSSGDEKELGREEIAAYLNSL